MGDRITQCGTGQDTRAACLRRLAEALSGYRDLEARVRADGPVSCLAVRNIAAPLLSETVTVSPPGDLLPETGRAGQCGDGLAFVWSWGKTIGDTGDPDSAAQAIAYVLAAGGARLGAR